MLTSNAVHVPTLFICGEKDQYIPPERTEELTVTFDALCIRRYEHTGGHMVPTCTDEFKRCLLEFLDMHTVLQDVRG